jgi:hypothetical protein
VALRQGFNGSSLSEQDYYLCRTAEQDMVRECSSGWTLKDGMLAFARLQRSGQLPVVEQCRPYAPRSTAGGLGPCARTCSTTLQELLQGRYLVKQLGSIVDMQRHIRQQGSIVCRMQLYSDIRPFFAKNPGAVYRGPGEPWQQEIEQGCHQEHGCSACLCVHYDGTATPLLRCRNVILTPMLALPATILWCVCLEPLVW